MIIGREPVTEHGEQAEPTFELDPQLGRIGPVTVPGDPTTTQSDMGLVVCNVSKSFGRFWALRNLTMSIAPGEVHALLGENGSGKSTLIKVLSGYHRPDKGSSAQLGDRPFPFGSSLDIYRMGARFVHQDLGLVGSSSVLDNLFLGSGFTTRWGTLPRRATRRAAEQDLERVGLDVRPSVLVESLSPAQKTSVAVARALRADPEAPVQLLVLDEPTASLPDSEVQHLLTTLRTIAAQGVAILYVSHRLDEVFEIANTVTVLREGECVGSAPVAELDRRTIVRMMIGRTLPTGGAQLISSASTGDTQAALEVRGLIGRATRDVYFRVERGEILGIAGITGSGRDELLGDIFGARPRLAGEVRADGVPLSNHSVRAAMEAGLGHVPAERRLHGLILDLSARENILLSDLKPFYRRGVLNRRAELRETHNWFTRLDIRPSGGFGLAMSKFSGGNQQKIVLAKWLRRNPKVLLLDEPTQGVDVGAKSDIHRLILELAAQGTAIVISSADSDDLVALCHRVLVMSRGELAHELSGTALSVANIAAHSLGIPEGDGT